MLKKVKEKLVVFFLKLRETGFFHVFGSSLINRIIGFVSVFLLVRVLPQDAYGAYSYVYAILSTILLFNGLGVVTGALQLCSEEEPGSGHSVQVFQYAARLGFIFDAILVVLLLVVSLIVVFPLQGTDTLTRTIAFLPLVILAFELI
ncbi:MAG: oligosaccharide flippase family protein, partial [Coriobacteriia bacterium]|nr:oligosaccharide flippase family protein [Coriobacteriia bacterium]